MPQYKRNYQLSLPGYLSLGLLCLLTLSLLSPTAPPNTQAVSKDDTFSSTVNTNVSTYVRSSIAISLSSSVRMDVIPKAHGSFETSVASLKVTTNNVNGYKVYLTTADDTSILHATNPKVAASINPVTGTMTSQDFASSNLDTWGYSISQAVPTSTTSYQAVPKNGEAAVISTDTVSSDDTYNLAFAVATSVDLPAGLYQNQVLASAVANPIEVRSLTDLTYMQEMTSEICTISTEHETKQLIDTRDGKSYWVAKLKDGNCWMTQNLALDITAEGLKANDTDIVEDWNSPAHTLIGELWNDQESPSSWNLGQYVVEGTSAFLNCSTTENINPLSNCIAQGVVDVSDWAPYNEEVTAIIDRENSQYDAHYLVGNYYNFNIATAGSSSTGSICPKGWRLPVGGKDSGFQRPAQNNDWYRLFYSYGYPETDSYLLDEWSNPYVSVSYINNGNYVNAAPIYIPRSGNIAYSARKVQ